MTAIGTISVPSYPPVMAKSGTASERRKLRKVERGRAYPNRIYELVQLRRTTYAKLADDVGGGVHEITIAKLATGKQKLTHDWMKRLAPPLGVRPEDIIAETPEVNLRRVRVRGALKAGTWAESHEWAHDDQFDVMIPDDAKLRNLELYAGRVEGDSMNRRFPNGSIVVLSRVGQRPGEIEVGKRYHVRQTRADGMAEETVKTLVADEHGRYWLQPDSDRPEHQEWIPLDGKPGVTVELIGRVRFVVQSED